MAHTEEREINKGNCLKTARRTSSAGARNTNKEGIRHNVVDMFGGTINGPINDVVDGFQESEESKSS